MFFDDDFLAVSSFCFYRTNVLYVCDRLSPGIFGSPGTHNVDQAGLKLQKSTCLCLPGTGIKDLSHYARLTLNLKGWFYGSTILG